MLRTVLALVWLAVSSLHAADLVGVIQSLDARIEEARVKAGIPGLAVGVVDHGKLIFAKGYGQRDVARNLPVTPRTVFASGSITKSFTATVAALLVDEGKLAWDRPVREYLPEFKLADPVATDLMTVRDLLCHRSGLPSHDFIRFAVPLDRRELIHRLRFLEPSASFRARYQYQNLMYVTAGYLEERVTGASWEKQVQERIFAPLGMTASTVSVLDMQKGDDFAKPYSRSGDSVREGEFYNYQEFGVGPNGAVNSSVEDLAKYLAFHMGDGRDLLSTAQWRELHAPQMVKDEDSTYALGWQLSHYGSVPFTEHSGSINGFRSWMGFAGKEHVGVIVMANLKGTGSPVRLGQWIANQLLGNNVPLAEGRGGPAARTPRMPKSGTQPSRELSGFTGEYFHPAFGIARVEREGDGLKLVFPRVSIPLRHFHYDIFESSGWFGGALFQFQMDEMGDIKRLSAPLEPAVKPAVFEKVR